MQPIPYKPKYDREPDFPIRSNDGTIRTIADCPSWEQIFDLGPYGCGRMIGQVLAEIQPEEDYVLWNSMVWERSKRGERLDYFPTQIGVGHIHAATAWRKTVKLQLTTPGPIDPHSDVESSLDLA